MPSSHPFILSVLVGSAVAGLGHGIVETPERHSEPESAQVIELAPMVAQDLKPDSGDSGPPVAEATLKDALPEPEEEAYEIRLSPVNLRIYTEPSEDGGRRGTVLRNEAFHVLERVDSSERRDECGEPGWGRVKGGGFVCLEHTESTQKSPEFQPKLVKFNHPDPREWKAYLATMKYERNPPDQVESMVPFIYAKRWRDWRGPNYASAEAYGQGDSPLYNLGGVRKYHFQQAIETERGTVLERRNGRVVPVDDIHIYPISKFHGRDLRENPIPEGMTAAWVVSYKGVRVRVAPRDDAEVGRVLDYHTSLVVEQTPVDDNGRWYEVPGGLGPGISGYVELRSGVRRWKSDEMPSEVGPNDLWVDVDLSQQMLAIMRGDKPEFVTLISSGLMGHSTPRGLYRIRDKAIYGDMSSRPGVEKEDYYYVEKVPWVMHFRPRYALHGVFWHWGFGNKASHGCINMAPRDAKYLFDRVSPVAHEGWHTAYESQEDIGTSLRVRTGSSGGPDMRYSVRN